MGIETAAAINCRYPSNLQYLCKVSPQHHQNHLVKSHENVPLKPKTRSLTESASTHFEDPCRRFVFAPACRGVTSKRSNEFGKTPKLSFASKPFLQSNANPSLDDLKEGLETSE